ncbi:MAG: sterol desaturase family protein [Burkholderiaceae bacterium]
MSAFLVTHETAIRLAAFVSVFSLMALWEIVSPRRARTLPRGTRWPGNLAVVAVNSVLLRLVMPTTAVALAVMLEGRQAGLLPALQLPAWLGMVISLLVLDLTIYLQHVLFHAVPTLWRLHRMHHADVDVDATNGLRFHPLEIMLSMGIKFAVIAALGPPAAAVVVFEVVLNATSIFNHSNVDLGLRFDRLLRWLLVTPDMHRVHHSWLRAEHDRNFGFNLSCWDRLFGTYLAQPRDGHLAMTLGLPILRDPRWCRLDRMLLQPFAADEKSGADQQGPAQPRP